MLFDADITQKLCAKYANEQDFLVPQFVFLARSDELTGEREYLEKLLTLVPDAKRKDFIGRLANKDDGQHLGAWFQIMLYGWLGKIGLAEIEPEVAGNHPDLAVSIDNLRIIVEATAIPITPEERRRAKRKYGIIATLRQIKKPFLVSVENITGEGVPELKLLFEKASDWLDHSPDEPFAYQDENGNGLILTAQHDSALKNVWIVSPNEFVGFNAIPLKTPLHNKARQHVAVRKAGYPYVLAMMLESWNYSAEEVVAAWFGETQVIDLNTNDMVAQRFDRKGIHFFGSEIMHTTVSGTLVFSRKSNLTTKMRDLDAWYIQNPYAKVPVNAQLFPVKDRFVILKRKTNGYSMGWELSNND